MKIATKLTKRVAGFVNPYIGGDSFYEESDNTYFVYPNFLTHDGFKPGHHGCELPGIEGYTEVSEQQFIDMVTAELKPKEMKTKCIVLCQENEHVKELKKIELKFHCEDEENEPITGDNRNACWWDNLVLLERDYEDGHDLIVGFTNNGSSQFRYRSLMLGHWNDGVV